MSGRKRTTSTGGRTLAEALAAGIRANRNYIGFSQGDLADAVTVLGIPSMTQRSVAKIESGERAVSFEEAVAFAVALDVSPLALFLTQSPVALTPTTTVPASWAAAWWRGDR